MIEINNERFSGSIIRDDDTEVIVSINTISTLQDLCLILNDVKAFTETLIDGTQNVYNVNNAVSVTATGKNCYTVTFSKRMSVLEEMSQAIDNLLVMVLEG